MKSLSRPHSPSISSAYNLQSVVSESFLVHWIFVIKSKRLHLRHLKQIKNIYPKIHSVNGKFNYQFNPICYNYEELIQLIKIIRNSQKNCEKKSKIIKLVAQPIIAESILQIMRSKMQLSEISQVFVLNCQQNTFNNQQVQKQSSKTPKSKSRPKSVKLVYKKIVNNFSDQNRILILIQNQKQQFMIIKTQNNDPEIWPQQQTQFYIKQQKMVILRLMKEYGELIVEVNSLDGIIKMAKLEIQKWQIKFQIFRNVQSLKGDDYVSKSFSNRVKIYACIRLNQALYEHYLQQFKSYVISEFKYVKQLLSTIKINKIDQMFLILKNAIYDYKKNNMNQFAQSMLSLYHNQISLFHELINNGIKKISYHKEWQKLMLPICLMFKAVKHWQQYLKQFQIQNLLQDNYLTVWRGGKISAQELAKIKSNNQQISGIFYQFNSFTVTTRNKQIAIKKILLNSERERAYNCLFQIKIKQNNYKFKQNQFQFLEPSFCSITNSNEQVNEDQILINAMTVAQLKNIRQISFKILLTEQKIILVQKKDKKQKEVILENKSNLTKKEAKFLLQHNKISLQKYKNLKNKTQTAKNILKYFNISSSQLQSINLNEKIPIIKFQIGSFIQKVSQIKNNNLLSTISFDEMQQHASQDSLPSKLHQLVQKQQYEKNVIKNYIDMIYIWKKYKQIQIVDVNELCIQTGKFYQILKQNVGKVQEDIAKLKDTVGQESVLTQLLYKLQYYDNKLSNVCYKMGKIEQAKFHNNRTIQKFNQPDIIDSNNNIRKHPLTLNELFQRSNQILIHNHQYCQANKQIFQKIIQLDQIQDGKQMFHSKVLIAILYIDLGVTNFKQGKLYSAQQNIQQSVKTISKVYQNNNFNLLKKQTFFGQYIFGNFIEDAAFLQDPTKYYYTKSGSQIINELIEEFGGKQKLQQTKKYVQQFDIKLIETIINNRSIFSKQIHFLKIINSILMRIENQIKRKKKLKLKIQNQKLKLYNQNMKSLQQFNEINQYNIKKCLIQQKLIQMQKKSYISIQLQSQFEKEIVQLQKMTYLLWENPIYKSEDQLLNSISINEGFLSKKQQNRNYLFRNSLISFEQLKQYYNSSESHIIKFIQKLKKIKYKTTTHKIIKQYISLIKLYQEIDNKQKANQIIQLVKKWINYQKLKSNKFNDAKQIQYYQLSIAYFLEGKNYYSEADIQFIILIQKASCSQKLSQLNKFRRQKIQKALQTFNKAENYLRKALIINQKSKQQQNVYKNDPMSIQILIWKVNSLLIKLQLSEKDLQIYKLITKLLDDIRQGINYIQTIDKVQMQAEYYQLKALYDFKFGNYSQSLNNFRQCISLRQSKWFIINWKNMQFYIKYIYYFSLVHHLKQEMNKYKSIICDHADKFKTYPFFWKICLANYFIMKDSKDPNQFKTIKQYLQQAIVSMETIGFQDQHFYLQYQLIYENQYQPYFHKVKNEILEYIKINKKQKLYIKNSPKFTAPGSYLNQNNKKCYKQKQSKNGQTYAKQKNKRKMSKEKTMKQINNKNTEDTNQLYVINKKNKKSIKKQLNEKYKQQKMADTFVNQIDNKNILKTPHLHQKQTQRRAFNEQFKSMQKFKSTAMQSIQKLRYSRDSNRYLHRKLNINTLKKDGKIRAKNEYAYRGEIGIDSAVQQQINIQSFTTSILLTQQTDTMKKQTSVGKNMKQRPDRMEFKKRYK